MRKVLILLSCLFLMQSYAVGVAHAEGTSVAAVDVRKLVEDSVAGKGIHAALKAKREALQKEASAIEKKLRADQQALISKRKDMKPEEFETKKKAFEAEFTKMNDSIRKKVTDLENQRKKALHTLQENVAKVTADIADAKKIKLVVDRELVVIVDQSLDLTAEVLKKLDERVKSIPLE